MRARPNEPLADWCEAKLDRCTGRATERHHRKYRSRGGSDAAENTVDICHACHEFIHAASRWATDVGLVVSRWAPEPWERWTRDQLEEKRRPV